MNYSRQTTILDPSAIKSKKISIVGVGALGSHIALLLAQMGWGNMGDNQGVIQLFDYDHVEEHNLPNQIFEPSHIGMTKVDAARDVIKRKCGFEIVAKNKKVEKLDTDIQKSDYVFLMTDTMSSRKAIYDSCIKYNFDISLFVEARMGINDGRVYAFDPKNKEHERAWTNTLCDDSSAEVSPCGTSMSIATMVWLLSTLSVSKVLHSVNQDRGFDGAMWNEAVVKLMPECFRYSRFGEKQYHSIPEVG